MTEVTVNSVGLEAYVGAMTSDYRGNTVANIDLALLRILPS